MSLEQLSLEQILQTHEDIEAEEKKRKNGRIVFVVQCLFVEKQLTDRHLANPTILGTICSNAYCNCFV